MSMAPSQQQQENDELTEKLQEPTSPEASQSAVIKKLPSEDLESGAGFSSGSSHEESRLESSESVDVEFPSCTKQVTDATDDQSTQASAKCEDSITMDAT